MLLAGDSVEVSTRHAGVRALRCLAECEKCELEGAATMPLANRISLSPRGGEFGLRRRCLRGARA